MRKFSIVIIGLLVILLSGCSSEGTVYNFKIRKDSYLINDDKTVILEYKTDENGELVEIAMDRLLSVEDMFYYNTEIDYDFEVDGFSGDIYTEAGFLCTNYEDLLVPINIEIGNTRFKYDYVECEYVEVDRDNEEKSGSFVRRYAIDDTIDVSIDTIVSIVVFDEDSIERFIETQTIPHTMKKLGIYSIGFNLDRDGFSDGVVNYYRDISIYEQLLLKHQENEAAVNEVLGISENINLLEFDEFEELIPLIDDFVMRYGDEITAFDEMMAEIGVITEEVTGEENEEPEE